MSWLIAGLAALLAFLVATNLHIIPDRETWVTERLGSRRFVGSGVQFLWSFDLERVVCKIPTQPQLVNMQGERFNIPDGTCNIVAALEYRITKPQVAYEQILTNASTQQLNISHHIQTLFTAAMRDVVKRLPIEALCEDEEDNTLASSLRKRIESDFKQRGLALVGDTPVRIQAVQLDPQAENARRIRYQTMKQSAARSIYARGETDAIKTIIKELDVDQAVAMTYYMQLKSLATLENLDGVFVSDLLATELLRMARQRTR